MVVRGHGELTGEPNLNAGLDNSKSCTLCYCVTQSVYCPLLHDE